MSSSLPSYFVDVKDCDNHSLNPIYGDHHSYREPCTTWSMPSDLIGFLPDDSSVAFTADDANTLAFFNNDSNSNQGMAGTDLPIHRLMPNQEHISSYSNIESEAELFALNQHIFDPRTESFIPPVPCDNCKKYRLQCLTIRTTGANPNPVTACSSCVALFRNCSLAEKAKRPHDLFETGHPVIGNLHGIAELPASQTIGRQIQIRDDDEERGIQVPLSASTRFESKRSSSHIRSRTRLLRQWFHRHQDFPFPSAEEKNQFAANTGLSRTQVENWFTNARRRQRHKDQSSTEQFHPQGSPMPQQISNVMLPFDRWRNSPPEDEHVSTAEIQNSIDDHSEFYDSSTSQNHREQQDHNASPYEISFAASFDDLDSTGISSSSVSSFEACLSADDHLIDNSFLCSAESISIGSATRPPSNTSKYQCTFCTAKFKKKSDWSRHETAIHIQLDQWICADQEAIVWSIGSPGPQCNFCGLENPDPEHLETHEFRSCAERQIGERTFSRKDHLRQHLLKFHGCRVWEGQILDISRHRCTRIVSRCGFCNDIFSTWSDRERHLADHFKDGYQMTHWSGNWGFEAETLLSLRRATLPQERSLLA